VSDDADALLAGAQDEIASARHLVSGGYAGQAVSRSYYGAFYAAEAALLALGETRSKHSGVISAFERLVVREGGLDPAVSAQLRSLFRRRNEADYGRIDPGAARAQRAIADAERVVDAVAAWLRTRER
jgi:uncharacterized protein (UPF0332 family)